MRLSDTIKKIIADQEEMYSQVCTVVSVDIDARTAHVKPINGDAEIFAARLQSEIGLDDEGLTIVPSVDSFVIVTFINKVTAYIGMTAKIDRVIWKADKGFHIASPDYNLTTEMNSFIDIIEKTLILMEQFQVQTNVGPSIAVMPHILQQITSLKSDLGTFKSNLNTILT